MARARQQQLNNESNWKAVRRGMHVARETVYYIGIYI
jgi:hypothetical protein